MIKYDMNKWILFAVHSKPVSIDMANVSVPFEVVLCNGMIFNKDFMHSIVDTIIYYYMTGVFVCQCDKCANWQCAAPQMTNETDLCIALVVFCHYHYYMQWQEMGLFDVHCSHVRMNNPVDIKQK